MKIRKIMKNIFVALVVAVAVVMAVFTIVSVSTFDQADRNLFGYKAFVILSDSMKKTDFAAGDLVLVKEVDPATLQEGDIIAYISQNSDSFGNTITHKIRRLTTDPTGEPGFITYGTTTDVDDSKVVTYPYVLGKYVFRIPKVGLLFQFLKTVPGYLLCILLPFALLILMELLRCTRLLRRYRAEQRALLQAERAQIEADRAKAQQMLRQIMALKAQMEQSQPSPAEISPPGTPQV